MSKIWTAGSTRAWRNTRAHILERDQHRCQLQLPGCTTIATEGHHTGDRTITGDNPAHAIAACKNCNLKTGDPRTHDPHPKQATQW